MQSSTRHSTAFEQQQRVVVLKIIAWKQHLNHQLSMMENLMIIENRLVEKIEIQYLKAKPVLPVRTESEALVQKMKSEDSISKLDKEGNDLDSDRTVFEIDEENEQTDSEFGFISRDEVYEAVIDSEIGDRQSDTLFSTVNQESNSELLANQEAVMTQLRDSLRPRRADMRSREKEAYVKLYGKEPDEDIEDEREAEIRQESSSSSSSSSFVMIPPHETGKEVEIPKYNDPIGFSTGIDASDIFGDEDEDESSEMEETLRYEFRESLEAVLRKRAGASGSSENYF